MEVILWSTMLGLAVLVTAIVVSLYYRHKYGPIFRQLSELLEDQETVVTNKTVEKPAATSAEKSDKTVDNPAEKTDKTAEKTNRNTKKPTERTDKTIDNPTNIAKNETVQEDKTIEDADGEMFKQLTDAIRNEQLYTTPRFGRKELMERFRLTSHRVSSVFSSAGTSVPEFIRECRLEHARRLIEERSDMTLVEIATASGFVHASTFTVDFKNKYGVSPTKYREQARSDELRSES